mgnify:CR=1 FL=1
MYFAPGATHAPHHVPVAWADKYKGKFDMGWDKARAMILENQIEMGIAPGNTKLSERIAELPSWDSLNDDEKANILKQHIKL